MLAPAEEVPPRVSELLPGALQRSRHVLAEFETRKELVGVLLFRDERVSLALYQRLVAVDLGVALVQLTLVVGASDLGVQQSLLKHADFLFHL